MALDTAKWQPLLIQVAERFTALKGSLAVVESCTGGGLAYALTALPGSSQWFVGGHVTYSNAAKTRHVYVRESTLHDQGAVSEDCVKEMANGGMVSFGVDCCLSISGIAGPDGGSTEKPVGLVWFGLAVRHHRIEAYEAVFSGDRESIRVQAIEFALNLLSKVSLKRAV